MPCLIILMAVFRQWIPVGDMLEKEVLRSRFKGATTTLAPAKPGVILQKLVRDKLLSYSLFLIK